MRRSSGPKAWHKRNGMARGWLGTHCLMLSNLSGSSGVLSLLFALNQEDGHHAIAVCKRESESALRNKQSYACFPNDEGPPGGCVLTGQRSHYKCGPRSQNFLILKKYFLPAAPQEVDRKSSFPPRSSSCVGPLRPESGARTRRGQDRAGGPERYCGAAAPPGSCPRLQRQGSGCGSAPRPQAQQLAVSFRFLAPRLGRKPFRCVRGPLLLPGVQGSGALGLRSPWHCRDWLFTRLGPWGAAAPSSPGAAPGSSCPVPAGSRGQPTPTRLLPLCRDHHPCAPVSVDSPLQLKPPLSSPLPSGTTQMAPSPPPQGPKT
ncbi:uncharacterized protein [Tursiops truncatus]|uniref:Anoctamin-8-like n=1 Tax=Tursiops truncatus TaxID=9739 RepID=A0A6J3QYZ6_TURTR|nr:anoctamin-8-like [Tursiops truncatus]XP_033707627.1 anoctamin-8-like [Tursiops truncatus]